MLFFKKIKNKKKSLYLSRSNKGEFNILFFIKNKGGVMKLDINLYILGRRGGAGVSFRKQGYFTYHCNGFP